MNMATSDRRTACYLLDDALVEHVPIARFRCRYHADCAGQNREVIAVFRMILRFCKGHEVHGPPVIPQDVFERGKYRILPCPCLSGQQAGMAIRERLQQNQNSYTQRHALRVAFSSRKSHVEDSSLGHVNSGSALNMPGMKNFKKSSTVTRSCVNSPELGCKLDNPG